MGYTRKIRAGLVKQDYTQFVGEQGILFYDEANGTLRISDGTTPGGTAVNLIGTFNDIALGNITINDTTISPNQDDTDLYLSAQGIGAVAITSPFKIHAESLSTPTVLEVDTTGKINIFSSVQSYESGVNIVGDTSRTHILPQNTGVLAQISGQRNDPSRIYNDGNNAYAAYIGRRYNNNPTAPTKILNNQIISRIGATPYTESGWPALSTARIDFVANQDQNAGAHGTRIEFISTPNGSTTPTVQATINGEGIHALNLSTSGRVNVTNTNVDTNEAILKVSTNTSGLTKTPVSQGTIAQFTGKDNIHNYILLDGYGFDVSDNRIADTQLVFRTARGTNSSPTNLQTGDIVGQIVAVGWGSTGFGNASVGQLKFVAAENFSDIAKGTKAVIGLIPPGSNSTQDILTIESSKISIANNGQFEGRAVLGPGTDTLPPLVFQAGPLLTVSAPGAMGYDGITFYGTPQDHERGIIPAEQVYVLNSTYNLTAGTTNPQSLFGVGITLSANTRYFYRIKAIISKNGSGSNAPTINYSLGGNATLFKHTYSVYSNSSATPLVPSTMVSMYNAITTNFNVGVPITAAMPVSTSYVMIEIHGMIDVNTAGTVIPQIAFSEAPNTSCAVLQHSNMKIYPIGISGVNTLSGTWA